MGRVIDSDAARLLPIACHMAVLKIKDCAIPISGFPARCWCQMLPKWGHFCFVIQETRRAGFTMFSRGALEHGTRWHLVTKARADPVLLLLFKWYSFHDLHDLGN